MSKKELKKEMPGTLHAPKKSVVDSTVYWLVQVAFAIAAVAGIKFYLQPVDPMLANVFAGALVSCLFYITYKLK